MPDLNYLGPQNLMTDKNVKCRVPQSISVTTGPLFKIVGLYLAKSTFYSANQSTSVPVNIVWISMHSKTSNPVCPASQMFLTLCHDNVNMFFFVLFVYIYEDLIFLRCRQHIIVLLCTSLMEAPLGMIYSLNLFSNLNSRVPQHFKIFQSTYMVYKL